MKKVLVLMLIMVAFLSSCSSNEVKTSTNDNEAPIVVDENNEEVLGEDNKIYTSIYPIEFIADRLIGDYVFVETVMPENGDIHNFDIPQKKLVEIAESDMYIFLGLGIEFNAKDISNALANEKVTTLEVGKYLENIEYYDEDHNEEDEDDHDDDEDDHDDDHSYSHIWIDPIKVLDMAEVIKRELIIKYPSLENEIGANFLELKNDLINLDNKYENTLDEADFDVFVVSHNKFKQWEKYDLDSIAVKDEAHSKDPSAKEVERIIETIRDLGLEYVVFEGNVPCIPLDRIRSETGVGKVVLSSLGARTREEIRDNKDYIDIMEENLEVLEQILNKN